MSAPSSLPVRALAALGRPVIAAVRATLELWGVLIGTLAGIIRSLDDAESVIHAESLAFYLDAMNILVPPDRPGAAEVPLLEFSTATPGSSRRVAFLAAVPRDAVAERKMDWSAGMRML